MIDSADISIRGGRGGSGAVSGRREKFAPRGGPDGGDGGHGGSVVLRCDENINTFLTFRYRWAFAAGNGGDGSGAQRHGKDGEDVEIAVPVGTEVWQADGTPLKLADLTSPGQRLLIAKGGRGGRGNVNLKSPTNRFPLLAEEGDPGQKLKVRLELKLLADVGIIGAPNAGKSSLLAAVSAARPRVADYPFTTLEPVLGVVERSGTSFVMVDIPGLIEGAHAGKGLGDEFLRHVERTRVLVHVLDGSADDPVGEYRRIRNELRLFNEDLAHKPEVVALNKIDVPAAEERCTAVERALAGEVASVQCISAVGRLGLSQLLSTVVTVLGQQHPTGDQAAGATQVERLPVLRPGPRGRRSIVEVRGGRFVVTLRAATRFAGRVDRGNRGAVLQLREQLRKLGVAAALEREGVKPGDVVEVGKLELEWE